MPNKQQDKKLRKEENLDLLKKLASVKVDTSSLKSAKNLGASKEFERVEEFSALIESDLLKDKKVKGAKVSRQTSHDNSSIASDGEISVVSSTGISDQHPTLKIGSGLKRPLDVGPDGNPIIQKRQRLSKPRSNYHAYVESPWEGFSSDVESRDHSSSLGSEINSVGTQTESDVENDLSETSSNNDTVDSADGNSDDVTKRRERVSIFKAWATQQANEAAGFIPSSNIVPASNVKEVPVKPKPLEQDPLPPELEVTDQNNERKAFSLSVKRSPAMEEARLALPIVAEEQKIMEAIYNNPVVVICGATGSGKTTQVPQFLYEAGFGTTGSPYPGIIGVTQPRRVAAVSMAKRVEEELGEIDEKVAYQIRFESSVNPTTAVKFMTDGILMREMTQDFLLSKYSVIVIDEAHERSTNTDILIGMVSRIVDLRASMSFEDPQIKPLKMIIMSATLRISDFLQNPTLFRKEAPPLIQIEGRQYPVTIHFARRTQRDYLEETFRKVKRGHKKLPPGGMLVFLTGQNEISTLAKRLNDSCVLTPGSSSSNNKVSVSAKELPQETEDLEVSQGGLEDATEQSSIDSDEDGVSLEADPEFEIEDSGPASVSMHLLPLYSQLQTKDQLRVFQPPPENSRLVVLATNVAETSLTIPGIRYVFDCGRVKQKNYDQASGVQSFEIGWISKASAGQRSGRAGRAGPGHCYRLYSSAVYERDFTEHAEPEISRTPVEGVVLQMKSMGLQQVVNFPFPTPPDRQTLAKAEKLLTYIGALTSQGQVTSIGRELSTYPLSPRLSKMLVIGHQHGCMPYTIAMVAALAFPDIFVAENQLDLSTPAHDEEAIYTHADQLAETARAQRRKDYSQAHHLFSKNSPTSDALKLLTALCAYAYASDSSGFCFKMFLLPKALVEASRLRAQISSIVHTNDPTLIGTYKACLPEPSKTQLKALEQIVAAAFIDQVAMRADLSPFPPDLPRRPGRAIDVPYFPLFPVHRGRVEDMVDKAVYIHPSSVLARLPMKELPQYVVYSHLQRGSPATVEGSKKVKTRMHALVSVTGNQLSGLAQGTPLLVYGKPIGKIEEVEREKRICWVGVELLGEKGREGWPMLAQKVVQKREKGEWVVKKVIG